MKRFFSYLLIFSFHGIIAQTNIETPYGFPNLYVNMPTSKLLAEMGQPTEVRSFESEKKVWVDGGYDISKSIAFLIGFDQVYLFDYQNKYCLWKAYVLNDQVIYMNLTSRYVREEFTKQLTIRNELHFHDSIAAFEKILGKNFFPDRGFGYTDYLYHDLGIRFTFKQGVMTNIYLYRRLTNKADLYILARHFPRDKE
ncbi:MAG: hypothetical protein WDZ35_12830 [Crocinitomicaceae bacterium]